jgi:hypothetical protein
MTLRVSKAKVWLTILFIFALGIETGVLLDLRSSLNELQQTNDSLEDTLSWHLP